MIKILLSINPIAFEIGKISVRWYGIILTFAMVIGLFILISMGKKKGISSDDSLELFLWLIPLAVIFSRVIYVLANNRAFGYLPIYNWNDFIRAIAIWDGGITIYGGVFGGIIGGLIWCKRKNVNVGMIFDICVPILLLCQSIGRWGNFFNQEAYGQIITNPKLYTLPFAVYIEKLGEWRQATFLYEGIVNFIGAIIAYMLWNNNKVKGALIPFYLVWYCMIRLILDFLRVDGLLVTKIACGIIIPTGIIGGIVYYRWGIKKLDHDAVKAEIDEMLDNSL